MRIRRDVEADHRHKKPATKTGFTNFRVHFGTSLALMNRQRHAMTCLRAGCSYSHSAALGSIDCS